MIKIRRGEERGRTEIDWLDSRHTFSFNEYYDGSNMGFRALRVINEDWVAAGAGFGTHPHRDMEIITYVLAGALEHRDSLGHGSVIRPGEVQRMSAGTGIAHSEYNHSRDEQVHLLQIWLLPAQQGLAPGYEQRYFDEREGRWQLIAARDGRDDALTIHQDVDLYRAKLKAGTSLDYQLRAGRHAWLQIARGEIELNGKVARAGDGIAISDESQLKMRAREDAEILLFDLA